MTKQEKLTKRKWVNEKLDSGLSALEVTRLALDNDITPQYVYKVARERKDVNGIHSAPRQVNEIVQAVQIPESQVIHTEAEVLPKTWPELKARIQKEIQSPEAIWQLLSIVRDAIDTSVGVAKVQMIQLYMDKANEYCPAGDGEVEKVHVRTYPEMDEAEVKA